MAFGLLGSGFYGYRMWQGPQLGSTRVYLDFEAGGVPVGRVVVGLYESRVPPTVVENFVGLATHKEGYGYRGSPVHQVVPGYCVMAGDITRGDGSGGASVFGPEFSARSPELRHTRGTVSMVVDDRSMMRSQFFITAMPMPRDMDKQMLACGRVVRGQEVVDQLTRLPADGDHRPRIPVRIVDSGVLPPEQS